MRLGSSRVIASSLSAGAFIFNPTIPSASSDDFSKVAICSIFFRFQGAAQAVLLASRTGTDSINSQTVRFYGRTGLGHLDDGVAEAVNNLGFCGTPWGCRN